MAKVEMSLQEYNEMMNMMNILSNIVDAMTTPTIDEWNLNYSKERHSSIQASANWYEGLTREAKEYLDKILKIKVDEFINKNDLAETYELPEDIQHTHSLFYLSPKKDESDGE